MSTTERHGTPIRRRTDVAELNACDHAGEGCRLCEVFIRDNEKMNGGETLRNSSAHANRGVTLIRDAEPADVRRIAQFQTDCWCEAYRGLVPQEYLDRVGVADRETRWRERLLSGARRIALAEDATGLTGVVSWGAADVDGGPTLELKSLYVAAEHRGAGLAARLLTRALGSAPAHLWVFEGNPRAHAFYHKHGFAFDGHDAIDPDTGVPERRMSRY